MKTLIAASLVAFSSLSVASLRAQTADEIVNKHIEAIGGKAVISSVKSLYLEGSIEVMGNEAPSTTYILTGKGFKNELDFNGTQIVQCVTDKGGWTINPMTGQTTATALPADQLKGSQLRLDIGGPLLDYASKGNKVELEGKDSAGYKLKLTTKDDMKIQFFIDPKTYYISKTIMHVNTGGQDVETVITFSDYKKTDIGYVMAYSQQITLPQVTLNMINKKVEVNKAIDPAIFEMPK